MSKKHKIISKIVLLSVLLGTLSSCDLFSGNGGSNSTEVEKKTLKSFFVKGNLTKTKYYVGDDFDPTGLSFIAKFSDNSETDVTSSVIFSATKMTLGLTSITATYINSGIIKTASITGFTVESVKPSELIFAGELVKSVYLVGETFDPTGLSFYCKYNNGDSIEVTDKVTFNVKKLALDSKVVASYKPEDSLTTFSVNITGVTVKNYLANLQVYGELTKKNYFVGDSLDPTGLSFMAIYGDSTFSVVTNEITFTPSTLSLDTTSVEASYTFDGVKKSVTVSGFTVEKPYITSLTYSGDLSKTYYYDGDVFDISGLTFTAHFADGTSIDVTDSVTYDSAITYDTTSISVSYSYEGNKVSCIVNGFKVDNPFDFEEGMQIDGGTVSLSSDSKTVIYKKDNSEDYSVKIVSVDTNKLLSNPAITSEINGGISQRGNSLKFVKNDTGRVVMYLSNNFIKMIGNEGFSFDMYSTVGINSNSVNNLTDGNGKILFSYGHQHPANKWMTYSFNKDQLSADGKFLILNGSTQGTYYLDNFKLNGKSTASNIGTFYFGTNEQISIPTNEDLRLAAHIELDNVRLNNSEYSISGSNIILNNVSNGEHEISFARKTSAISGDRTSLYFGLYKATSKITTSCSVSYGSDGYTQINELSNVNRIVHNGKSIAFEKSGMNTIIPNATLAECLPASGDKKVSGVIKLIALLGESNAECKEIEIGVTLNGDGSQLTSREYSTDETYHVFGYSSTGGGGNANTDLISEDLFMNADRGGMECIYEQVSSVSSGTLTKGSFYGGANDRVRRDLELCDQLGKKCYIIDAYIRNLINLTSQPELIGEGCTFTSFDDMVNKFYERLPYYAYHTSLAKIVICDEPRYFNLVAVGQVYRALKAALLRYGRADIEVDANLLPLFAGWGSDDGIGTITGTFPDHIRNYPKRTAIYKNYLKKFIDETGADYISYDIYPLWDGSKDDTWSNSIDECAYSNLIVAAEFCKENNVELHVVTESFTQTNRNSGKNRREMSRDDMHWLCNQLVGFGVTRVSFFTYYNRAANSTEFSADGDYNNTVGCMKIEQYDENKNLIGIRTTQVYYNAQCMLEEMNEFKNIALNFKYKSSNIITGSYLTQKQDATTRNANYGYPVEWGELVDTDSYSGEVTNITIDKEYCLTSVLTDDDNNYMYMVQNCCEPRLNSLQTSTLTVSSGSYAVIYENGARRVVNISNNKLTLKLAPGNAAFVMIY